MGNILTKTVTLRITLNIDDTPTGSRVHTHPSHSETSRLLTVINLVFIFRCSSSPLSHVTGLWTRPVIRYRPVTRPYRITTSPVRTGTGEPLHRLEPVPVRGFTGTGSPVGRCSQWQTYRRHRTKSVGLYHPIQRTHIQLNMNSEVRV